MGRTLILRVRQLTQAVLPLVFGDMEQNCQYRNENSHSFRAVSRPWVAVHLQIYNKARVVPGTVIASASRPMGSHATAGSLTLVASR